MRVEPVLEPVEGLLQTVERFGGGYVRGQRITVAGHARERLHQTAHALVEFGVVRSRHLILPVQAAHRAPDRRRRERRGQRGRGPLLALVRLVEDRVIVGRQERAAQRQIQKEERVIHYHDVGILGRVAPREEVTVAKAFAEFADAVVGVGIEQLPLVPGRREGQFGAVARLGASRPIPHRFHGRALRDQPIGAHAFELGAAQIVVAAFEQFDARRDAERLGHERDVLAHELFLQRDRGRRDDDLLAATQRRGEVGQRFADAGAGFNERVGALEKSALDQARHLDLAGARLEAGQRSRERPIGREDRVERLSPGRAHRGSSSAASRTSPAPAGSAACSATAWAWCGGS